MGTTSFVIRSNGQLLNLTSLVTADNGTAVPLFSDAAMTLPVSYPQLVVNTLTTWYLSDGWSGPLTLGVSQADGTVLGPYTLRVGPGLTGQVEPQPTALQQLADTALTIRWQRTALPTTTRIAAVMASPPTVGPATGSSAIGSGVTWRATGATTSGSPLSHAHFTYRGCGSLTYHGTANPDYNYMKARHVTDGLNPTTPEPMGIDFLFDGTTLEIKFKDITTFLRIKVNGELVSATPVTITNTAAEQYLPITFGTRAVRKISLESSNNFVFGGVVTGPLDSIAKTQSIGPRCIVLGDSFVEGTGATGGGSSNFVRTLSDALGWQDMWLSGLGGTGYLQTNGARVKYRDRAATDVIAYNPDVVIIAGGYNDYASFSTAAIQTEATALFAQLRAGLPNVTMVVVSPWWHNGVNTYPSTLLPARDAIKAAARVAGALFVDLLELPLDGVPLATTFNTGASSGSGTISTVAAIPPRCTIDLTTERRVVTALAGTGPYTLTLNANLTNNHSSGDAVTEVGPSMWTGTGKVGGTTGDGNADLITFTDGSHPAQPGHDLIGWTLANLISRQMFTY